MLVTTFAIDAARIETDGKGETQPVADNKTREGKALNRRVEFVKR
jgi:outer membrane protein OmpA-like peptidoglycan-associated protein